MAHNVFLEETFRGPLDLLLHLVKRDEIDIHDIPIAHLTREYLAEIDRMTELDVDLASEFLTMASMLMEIKSRMLLPPAETLPGEEDEEDFDPRGNLVQALLEYKRFKEAASALEELAETHALRVPRIAPRFEATEEEGEEIEDANVVDLLTAFQGMIRAMLSKEAVEIVNEEVPTEVRIAQITETLAAIGETRFSKLLSSEPTKAEMVGFFIALMELIRLGRARAWQSADFTDIIIARRDPAERNRLSPQETDGTAAQHRRAPRALFAPPTPKSARPARRTSPFPACAYAVPLQPKARRGGLFPACPRLGPAVPAAMDAGAGVSAG